MTKNRILEELAALREKVSEFQNKLEKLTFECEDIEDTISAIEYKEKHK